MYNYMYFDKYIIIQTPHTDIAHAESCDLAADPAHLYSFVHQLQSLKITLPPPDTSVCCSNFEMSHFRALHTLKVSNSNSSLLYLHVL